MAKNYDSDEIVWEPCYCGCHGDETVYRGRYFWMTGAYVLFSEHNARGCRVGKFLFDTRKELEAAIRQEYRRYPVMKRLPWHPCKCPKGGHLTVCHKGVRFYIKWDAFTRRAALFLTHSGKRTTGNFRSSEIDSVVRRIARQKTRKQR